MRMHSTIKIKKQVKLKRTVTFKIRNIGQAESEIDSNLNDRVLNIT